MGLKAAATTAMVANNKALVLIIIMKFILVQMRNRFKYGTVGATIQRKKETIDATDTTDLVLTRNNDCNQQIILKNDSLSVCASQSQEAVIVCSIIIMILARRMTCWMMLVSKKLTKDPS